MPPTNWPSASEAVSGRVPGSFEGVKLVPRTTVIETAAVVVVAVVAVAVLYDVARFQTAVYGLSSGRRGPANTHWV